MAVTAYTEPYDLSVLLPATVFNVANTTKVVAPARPSDGVGVVAGAAYFDPPAKGGRFYVNVSAISGVSASVTVSVVEYNASTGLDGNTILATAALTATGQVVLDVYPGLTASANAVANQVLTNFRLKVAMSNTTTPSATVEIDAEYIP